MSCASSGKPQSGGFANGAGELHSYIRAGRFHVYMKICLYECTKGAPRYKQKRAAQAAESHEVAVKPSSEGFADGAGELSLVHSCNVSRETFD